MIQSKIRAILEKNAVSFRTNSKSFILDCPKCNKKNKLYIRKEDGRFVCWVCQEKEAFYGKAEWALLELTGESLSELRYFLYEGRVEAAPVYLDIQISDFFDANSDEVLLTADSTFIEIEPHPDFLPITDSKSQKGAEYLASRGIPLDIQAEYRIMYWPAKRSVVFPAYVRGKLVGWQTRIAGSTSFVDPFSGEIGELPKAQTSIGLKKDRLLMFQDRIVDHHHVILAEGPIDALKAHLCGGNVASLGKNVSNYQLDLIRQSGVRKLYLALDPDAFNESQAILKKMAYDLEIFAMVPPSGDLGGMSFEEVHRLYLQAPKLGPNHLFLWLNRELYNGI